MPIIYIDSLDHPGVDIFYALTEAQLRNKQHSDKGLFIAESPKVIEVALQQGFIPTALLCEERHITGRCCQHHRSKSNDTYIHWHTRCLSFDNGLHAKSRCVVRHETPYSSFCRKHLQHSFTHCHYRRGCRYNEYRCDLPLGSSTWDQWNTTN